MWFLLSIGFVLPFVVIGYLMTKLDTFLGQQTLVRENSASPVAIVLGETDLAIQVTELLKEHNIGVLLLNEPFLLEREQKFRFLFALSANDADNIVMCKIGIKVYGIESMISLCNDRGNEQMLMRENIKFLLSEEANAQLLYQTVVSMTEGKVC
ncbi:MAG: hypothetical protein NUK65_07915 [Firmicutes bacterium]|nr:hypothetical protein [Bacillota bacterium]